MDSAYYEEFKGLFPTGTNIVDISGSPDNFVASLRCTCKSKEEFLNWLQQYQDLSKTTFRVAVTRPRTGKTVMFKASYRCQHNTYPKSHQRVKNPHPKHTDCSASLSVTIKSGTENRRVRSRDELRADFPTIIKLTHNHNHEIIATLKFREMSDEVKDKLINMFQSHHSPYQALNILKQDLLEEYEDDYHKISSDSSICPDIQAVHKLFRSHYKKKTFSIQGLLEGINELADPQTRIMCEIIDEKHFVLAALPPLMRRVHDLEAAGETVFIDTSTNMERFNCKVFLLLCGSSIGELPLGFFLTTLETEDAIVKGLRLLGRILPTKAFGGRSSKEPQVFITEDCQEQINAIRTVFENSEIYLSSFHILQTVWRWLLHSSYKICDNDRQYSFRLFKKTMFSKSEEEFQEACTELLSDSIVGSCPDFREYAIKLFQNAKMWSLCYRKNTTNNKLEDSMKLMKEKILHRTKAYNPVQLFKFVEADLCDYYARKVGNVIKGEYCLKRDEFTDLEVTLESEIFMVRNKKFDKKYTVNLEVGLCSCPVGVTGASCKHKIAALEFYQSRENITPMNSGTSPYYNWVAYGTKIPANCSGNSLSTICHINEKVPHRIKHESKNLQNETKPDWFSLQNRINLLCDKWKTNNSAECYDRLYEAVAYLENCQTESVVTSALHSLGRNDIQIPVQATSVSRRKRMQNGKPLKKSRVDHVDLSN